MTANLSVREHPRAPGTYLFYMAGSPHGIALPREEAHQFLRDLADALGEKR